MRIEAYAGRSVVPGAADGELLHADVGLSFMGGVDSSTGRVIDTHHPLHGQSVDGKVLALPSGRGSCSGSASLFELLVNRHAPVALIFRADEPILTLGVILAAEVFGVSIPVVRLSPADFAQLRSASRVSVRGGRVTVTDATAPPAAPTPLPDLDLTDFRLSVHDRQLLSGAFGEAARLAIRVVIRAAQLEGAHDLIDIDRGHIDGCFYQGPASLRFAERLVELGGQVAVPTSMNSLCIDRRRWRDQGVPAELGEPSEALADAYLRLGVTPTYTCAPYLLDDPPARGQQIAWAESNAVVFANAVIGARTMKYPDYLDILIALIGRAPNAGAHTDAGRRATLQIAVDVPVEQLDDAFYPTLGYHVGTIASNDIPVLTGLELSRPDRRRSPRVRRGVRHHLGRGHVPHRRRDSGSADPRRGDRSGGADPAGAGRRRRAGADVGRAEQRHRHAYRHGRPRQPALLADRIRAARRSVRRPHEIPGCRAGRDDEPQHPRESRTGRPRRPPRAVRRPPGQRHLLVPDRRAGGHAIVADHHDELGQVRPLRHCGRRTRVPPP